MFFVARIHNNSLGNCVKVENWDQGIKIILDWCEEQDFVVDLEEIHNSGEYYNDDDANNVFCFSIGILND